MLHVHFDTLCGSVIDNSAMGGMVQGHGMVLSLHLVKLLKSSRKFVHLMTKRYDDLKNISCIGGIHQELKVSMG